jgi:tetratricopeptide (TPR) repeat protein
MACLLKLDQLVLLNGLQNLVLNGATGVVIRNQEFDSTGRYSIQLRSPSSIVISFPSPVKIQAKNLVVIQECGRPSCVEIATKKCSACNTETYCSPECQRLDWKIHKSMCVHMKNPNQLLPFDELLRIIMEHEKQTQRTNLRETEKIRLMRYYLSFSIFQFGDRVEGKDYRERLNGFRIDNWRAEIVLLGRPCYNLALAIDKEVVSHLAYKDFIDAKRLTETIIPWYVHALSFLEPWGLQLNLPENERIVTLDKEHTNLVLNLLSETCGGLGTTLCTLENFSDAEGYIEKSLFYARKIGQENILYKALTSKGSYLTFQSRDKEAKACYEEGYEIMSALHSLDHPVVLEAAKHIITNCMNLKDYYDCERYARVVYQYVSRPIDRENLDVADAALDLSSALCGLISERGAEGGSIVEAEMLVRKSIRISEGKFSPDILVLNYAALSNIQAMNKDLSEERRCLLQLTLDIRLKREGADYYFVGVAQQNLGVYHRDVMVSLPPGIAREEQRRLGISYCKEAIRVNTKLHGISHEATLNYTETLSYISSYL